MQSFRQLKLILLFSGLLLGLESRIFADPPGGGRGGGSSWNNGSTLNVYVSPIGNDGWSGLLPNPDRRATDGPFLTFHRAREFVAGADRSLYSRVNVFFREGIYPLSHPVKFSSADSGSDTLEIVYQNYPGEEAIISGGIRLTGWQNTGGNRWVASLPANAATPFENLYYNGERRLRPRLGDYLGVTPPANKTDPPVWNRVANPIYSCTLSDACNGPATNTCTNDNGQTVSGQGYECFDRFRYDPNEPAPVRADWKNLAPQLDNPCHAAVGAESLAGDIELLIFEQFNTSKFHIDCVDGQHHIVYLHGKTTPPSSNKNNTPPQPQEIDFSKDSRYIVENVQDNLKLPGQWFLDRAATPAPTVTYMAKAGEDPNRDIVVVPQISQLITGYDLHYVTFRGLIFEHDNYVIPLLAGHSSREMELDVTSAISFRNSSNIIWDANVIRHTAGGGLDFISCLDASVSPAWCRKFEPDKTDADNLIINSAFHDLGLHGIRIGDVYNDFDTDTNVPERFNVENNVVAGYGRTIPASFGIAQGNGNHNAYMHNDVYDGYHCAISLIESAPAGASPPTMGNAYNIIAYNHAHDLLQGIMSDGGSIRIESGTSKTSPPGNQIRNNKIHDTTDASILDAHGYGGHGIYLDNDTGNIEVNNNLVYRVSGASVYTPHGPQREGYPNIVQNNIFAYARKGILDVNDPYAEQTGPNYSSVQIFQFTYNLVYFDRFLNPNPTNRDPGFSVNSDCTWTTHKSPSKYPGFLFFDHNDYWRTDHHFADDLQAFYIQKAPDSGSSPCARPDPTNQGLFDWFSFAQWQTDAGEDPHGKISNPHFLNPSYPYDDYRLKYGSPIPGFIPFDPDEDGRYEWARWYMPPNAAPTFSTLTFDPATDF